MRIQMSFDLNGRRISCLPSYDREATTSANPAAELP
jgi:hypothetical protein